jgi:hypothetical protein
MEAKMPPRQALHAGHGSRQATCRLSQSRQGHCTLAATGWSFFFIFFWQYAAQVV